jgi:hypothetical protein
MVWIIAGSVSGLPSSMTTFPLRKIVVLGDRSGAATRGRLGVRRPTWAEAIRVVETTIRQDTARRLFMDAPTATTLGGIVLPMESPNCQFIVWGAV